MSEKIRSYYDYLQFDPALGKTFKAKYITNIRLVLLFLVSIILIGIISFFNLPRRLNPEIKIPIVAVSTVLPGAGPDDVEKLITIPYEDVLESIKGVKTVTSTSQDNVSIIQVEFNSGTDIVTAENDVKRAVEGVSGIPDDARDPNVVAFDIENQPVWTFGVSADGDKATLARFTDELQKRLKDLAVVDKVNLSGTETRQIQIVVSPEKISEYGINPLDFSRAVGNSVKSYPAGQVISENSNFSLSVDATANAIEDIRNLQVSLNGTVYRLSDLASISERAEPGASKAYYADHKLTSRPVVTFYVYKTKDANIDQTVDKIREVVDKTKEEFGNQFTINSIEDTSKEISDQFGDLTINFRDTIFLVFLTLFVFLGIRQAIIASLTIPLTFFVTFTIMRFTGLTLNFLSLFSLLLALGLLVDDTIVVVTAMTAYYRTGKFTPRETGLLVWRDFIVPIWTTTIATVWAFLPLLLSTGIIGEFIKTIPITVAVALYTSTTIAVAITLPLMIAILHLEIPRRVRVFFIILTFVVIGFALYLLIKTNPLFGPIALVFTIFLFVTYHIRSYLISGISRGFKRITGTDGTFVSRVKSAFLHGIIDSEKMSQRYKGIISRVLATKVNRRNIVFAVVSFMLFSYLLLPFGFIQNEFFPKSDQDFLYLNLELPSGTSQEKLDVETVRLLNELRQIPELKSVTAEEGSVVSLDGPGGGNAAAVSSAKFTINLEEKKLRNVSSIDLAEKLREKYSTYTTGKISVVEVSGGPPAGSDIQIKLFGDDLALLNQYANTVEQYLTKKAGITTVDISIKPSTAKLVFVPDQTKMADSGIGIDQIGLALRMYASGFPLESVRFSTDKTQDIVFRVSNDRISPEDLGRISVASMKGSFPLLSLGDIRLGTNPTAITRENGKRTLSVAAGVARGYSISEINADLEKFANNDLKLPEGYSWQTGGVNEENTSSVQSIFQSMGIAFVLILITMVIQLGSYRSALLVTLVIPPAISGVFLIFALTGTPLSFPALIGVLALFGIVVNNSIVLVDKINQNMKIGMELGDAISDAAASRFEPIFFGSMLTIVGLVPITIQDPLWRGLGGAIISGLLFSGAIMLFFIPVVYYMWFDKREITTVE
jgi:multidrug efflux pump subunit AcrB